MGQISKDFSAALKKTFSGIFEKLTTNQITKLMTSSASAVGTGVAVSTGSILPIIGLVGIYAGLNYLSRDKKREILDKINQSIEKIAIDLPESFEVLWQTECTNLEKLLEINLTQKKQNIELIDIKKFCQEIHQEILQQRNNIGSIIPNIHFSDELLKSLSSIVESKLESLRNDQKKIKEDLAKLVPSIKKDLAILRKWSQAQLDSIPDKIAHNITIECKNEIESVLKLLNNQPTSAIILGNSGSGKTVLGKNIISCTKRFLWIPAEKLNTGISFLSKEIGLGCLITDCIKTETFEFICVDSLERLNSIGYNAITELSLIKCSNLILICQEEQWKRVETALQEKIEEFDDWPRHIKEAWGEKELSIITEQYPVLLRVLARNEIKTLITKPQILNLLCLKSNSIQKSDYCRWIGEIDIIQWIFEKFIGTEISDSAKTSFILNFSKELADNEIFSLPCTRFTSSDLYILASLTDVLCSKNGKISFVHDLFGDWARLQYLIANDDTTELESRYTQPYWQNAIRLFGTYLLEKNTEKWNRIIEAIPQVSIQFLESIIYTGETKNTLDSLQSFLFNNKGELLKQFFQRFLYIATEIDPLLIKHMSSQDISTVLATRYCRTVPKVELWSGVLAFILKNEQECTILAPHELFKIVKIWLQATDKEYPFTKELSVLVYHMAEKIRAERIPERYIRDKETDLLIYQLLLQQASVIPDKTESFVKKIISDTNEKNVSSPNDIWLSKNRNDIDTIFEECVLRTSALCPLMRINPSLAKDVILLTVIEPYYEWNSFGSQLGEDVSIKDPRYLQPNFWDQGPFYNFLEISSQLGVELIIDIVNFATERHVQTKDKSEEDSVNILIDGELRKLNGGYKAFYWYRGIVWNPHLVSSALMALEKWFYEKLENAKEIPDEVNDIIDLIMQKMTSVSFAGLLFEIGRKSSMVMLKTLALFSIADLYYWEQRYSSDLMHMRISFSGANNKKYIEWNKFEHRSFSYINPEVLMRMYIQIPDFKNIIDSSRCHWLELVKKLESQCSYADDIEIINNHDFHALKKMAIENYTHLLDMNHYTVTDHDGKRSYEYNPPENKSDNKNERALELLQFPFQCQRYLVQESQLSDNELEVFWDNGKRLCDTPEYFKKYRYTRDTIVQAMIAVILKNHFDWLAQDEEKIKWVSNEIKNFALHPYGNIVTCPENDMIEWDEYTFWAQSIAYLWINDPCNEGFRQWVCYAATSWKYITVKKFLETCYLHRSELNNNFYQLLHFILEWSMVLIRIPHENRFRKDTISNEKIKEWLNNEIESFVQGNYATDLLINVPQDTSLVHAQRYHRLNSNSSKIYIKEFGFDYCFLIEVFKEIMIPHNILEPTEQKSFSSFWGHLLETILKQREAYDLTGNKLTDYEMSMPYPAEGELISIIVRWAIAKKDFTQWQAIIDLGDTGKTWIKNLFRDIFIYSTEDNDFTLLCRIIEYYNKNENDIATSYDLKKELLGFGSFQYIQRSKITHKFIQDLASSYIDIGHQMLSSKYDAKNYIRWIYECDAAQYIWWEIITLMKELIAGNKFCFDNADELAIFLKKVWDNEKTLKLRQNKNVYEAYKALLHSLCEKNNQLALALRDEVIQNH